MKTKLKENLEANENIQAAGLLSKLADMFFSGLGKALDSAAEYEEEMGVLKQVNRIPIESSDGKVYTLKIELSPVRNKDNYYFVEASTDAPGLDVSSLNKKTMRIDNTNMKQFKETIDSFLKKQSYNPEFPEEEENDSEGAEVVGEEASKEDGSNASQKSSGLDIKIDNLIKEVNETYKHKAPVTSKVPIGIIQLKVIMLKLDNAGNAQVEISGYHVPINDEPGSVELVIDPEIFEIKLLLEDSENLKDQNEVLGEVSQFVLDYVENNGLSRSLSQSELVAATRVKATFVKDSKTGDVSITAITASTDIKSAMDVVYDIVEDDDFVDQLDEDTEQSFEIIDESDDYDIECIDSVDRDECYIPMFNLISQFNNKLETLRWALGRSEWNKDSMLSELSYSFDDLIEVMAIWVIDHTGMYPVSVAPFGNNATDLIDYKNEQGQIDSMLVHDSVKHEVEELLQCLEVYYINLNHEEQNAVDSVMEHVKGILVYA